VKGLTSLPGGMATAGVMIKQQWNKVCGRVDTKGSGEGTKVLVS